MQLLHTFSLNAGDERRELLCSELECSAFDRILERHSNTLASGLAQLLLDWKYMFGYDVSLMLCLSYSFHPHNRILHFLEWSGDFRHHLCSAACFLCVSKMWIIFEHLQAMPERIMMQEYQLWCQV